MSKKIALVTGGTGGIGTAICQDLANSGLQVVANFLPGEEAQAEAWLVEQRKTNADIHIAAADVTDYDSCTQMLKKIEADLGPVDVLVNCAGITRDKSLKGMTPDQWNAVINTNLKCI